MKNLGSKIAQVLVAIGLLLLLASILFPIFATAKVGHGWTKCSENLRKLGLSIQVYAEVFDGEGPWDLARLAKNGGERMNICPSDNFSSQGGQWCQLVDEAGKKPCIARTSYGYVFGQLGPLEGHPPRLSEGEQTFPTLIVCVLHGSAAGKGRHVPTHSGSVLRLMRDGSLNAKRVPGTESRDLKGFDPESAFTP